MPNYARALPIDTVRADELTEQEFYRNYVAKNRPCHIVGAATHWPGYTDWTSVDKLKAATRNAPVPVNTAPVLEFPPTKIGSQEELDKRAAAAPVQMPFHEFLDQASSRSAHLVARVPALVPGGIFSGLLRDIGKFRFLQNPRKTMGYAPLRAFFYRQSYTDWHCHPADETLMTQVVGAKEVLLLPPDDQSWDALYPVVCQKGYLYDVDLEAFPAVGKLRPLRAVVGAGDALYIPVYWWHAVASADDSCGVTVAACFGTPPHVAGDLRHPFARKIFKDLLTSRLAPLALIIVCYAYLYRALAPLRGR